MKKIGKLVKRIEEELEDGMYYASKYIECRADGDSMCNVYKEMAQDELKHADNIHSLAAAAIDKVRSVYTPSMEMQEKWDECHQKYIAEAAEIKRMLSI